MSNNTLVDVKAAFAEAVHFLMHEVPHEKGQCFIVLPIHVLPRFDTWLAANRADFLSDPDNTAYTGIACPDPACGFFAVRFRDNKQSQTDITHFINAMGLTDTPDYLIIRPASGSKEFQPKLD